MASPRVEEANVVFWRLCFATPVPLGPMVALHRQISQMFVSKNIPSIEHRTDSPVLCLFTKTVDKTPLATIHPSPTMYSPSAPVMLKLRRRTETPTTNKQHTNHTMAGQSPLLVVLPLRRRLATFHFHFILFDNTSSQHKSKSNCKSKSNSNAGAAGTAGYINN